VPGLRAVGSLPDVCPVRFPLTALGQAMLKAVDGLVQEARETFSAIAARLDPEGLHAGVAADLSNVHFALQSYEDCGFDPDQVSRAELASQLPEVAPGMRVLTENFVVIAMSIWGDSAGTVARSNGLMERNRAIDATYAELYVAIYRGLALLRLGEIEEARTLFAYIAHRARERYGPASNHAANGEIFLARIDYLRGDLASAERLLDEKMQSIEYAEGTCDIILSAFEVGLGLARRTGDAEAVSGLIERADLMGQSRAWPRLSGFAACWRVREHVLAGRLNEARTEVDRAGLEGWLGDDMPGWRWSLAEEVALVLAQLELEEKNAASALPRMRALEADLRTRRHQLRLADALLLKAAALHRTGAAAPALVAFQESLRVATACGLRSLFRDQGELCRAAILALATPAERLRFDMSEPPGERPSQRKGGGPDVTDREVEVLCAMAEGLSNKEAAQKLAISESTVKFHRKNLYRKLNVSTRSRALSTARDLGLVNTARWIG
jgi:LuxR family maltose regulon positive regulatory protein